MECAHSRGSVPGLSSGPKRLPHAFFLRKLNYCTEPGSSPDLYRRSLVPDFEFGSVSSSLLMTSACEEGL
ncbi:hypothetical protein MPTK1_8g11308 [Marchantia polymorpha subsp. ruderalis]|uniref:Uncharacterized protein n=2 Tax=Marchantia polymorpha TaxID=3197 RepID=A0A679DYK5_MARPO|nr:hypothetical protein MARPO_0008s0086 [Marchantia polymorpha]BBN20772.1 hypothetical protein Mp_zg01270 [Marchantia polymorpha subsp. ruderalis]|eukprot:PTQ47309.1 hypothetical protein MARPO_0008s0086 [Marchantia polymorpha]